MYDIMMIHMLQIYSNIISNNALISLINEEARLLIMMNIYFFCVAFYLETPNNLVCPIHLEANNIFEFGIHFFVFKKIVILHYKIFFKESRN